MTTHMRHQGFTLMELSVVLLIFALLTGSILAGQSLIRSSKLNAVVTDIGVYTQAVNDFRDKFQTLPGDMANATAYWGRADGGADLTQNCAAPATNFNAANPKATCNGDGNGFIDGANEQFRAWQHLANAGLIPGVYTGIAGAGGANDHTLRVNAPAAMLDGGGFDLLYVGNMVANANYYDAYYPLKLGIGAKTTNGRFDNPIMTPPEAWGIDSKIDDGAPGTGNIVTFKSPINPGCTTTDVATTADYVVGSNSTLCSLNIIIPDPVK